MRSVGWRERLRYGFDNSMARGPIALIGWLALLSASVVLLVTFVVWVFGIAPNGIGASPGGEADKSASFIDVLWFSLVRTLDSGTMGGDTGRWSFLFSMLAVTFGGIFVISTFIGVLSSGIEGRLETLRKGRSHVLESGHTLILGWSPQIFTIVSELAIANQNRRKPRIVVLANRDMVEMLDEIREMCSNLGRTRVICRTGDPLDLRDLDIVNPHEARSIIVLESAGEHGSAHAIKAILALTNNPNRRATPYHIVAEINDPKDMPAARMVGGDEAVLVETSDLISRIIVQTSRQSGLSVVYLELLDFGGDEIYFAEEPRLVGVTFGDALLAFETSAVIGLRNADGVRLNPRASTVIEPGDRLIAISADDDTITLSAEFLARVQRGGVPGPGLVDQARIVTGQERDGGPERTLILGWNRRGLHIVRALDAYVELESTVCIVATPERSSGDPRPRFREVLQRQTVEYLEMDTTDRGALDGLKIEQYDQVIVLPYTDTLGVQEADANTLMTLLHLRDMRTRSAADFRIVTEMIDLKNRELADVTGADDFIVSSRLTSLMLTQISENRELGAVFADLLDPEGSELYLKPVERYLTLGEPVNFHTAVASARARGEVAIGYRIDKLGHNAGSAYGVKVNPAKSANVTFAAGDSLIVLAEG